MKINDFIYEYEKKVPLELQEEWDNSGFQFGNKGNVLKGIVLSLDFGLDVVSYTIENSFNFIFVHHPVFFKNIKVIDFNTIYGKAIELAIKNDISVYSSHTNLDIINGGVNDVLANALSMKAVKPLFDNNKGIGLGRYGYIQKIAILDFIENLKVIFGENTILSYGNTYKEISKIGVLGGSGSIAIDKSIDLDLDLLITSDIKYHDAEYAVENNLILIDLGHYVSEKMILSKLYDEIKTRCNTPVLEYHNDKSMRKFL